MASSKRRFEEDATSDDAFKRARDLYSKVGVLYWASVKKFLAEGDAAASKELIEGLSMRDFHYLHQAAEEELGPIPARPRMNYPDDHPMRIPDMAQRILRRHKESREEQAEVARLVFEHSRVSERLQQRLQDPMTDLIRARSIADMIGAFATQSISSERPPDRDYRSTVDKKLVSYRARPAEASAAASPRPIGFRMRY